MRSATIVCDTTPAPPAPAARLLTPCNCCPRSRACYLAQGYTFVRGRYPPHVFFTHSSTPDARHRRRVQPYEQRCRHTTRRGRDPAVRTPDRHPHDMITHSTIQRQLSFLTIRFHLYLTLRLQLFSVFVHTTFSLSVSEPYLALRVVYPAICAAIPNYATLQ